MSWSNISKHLYTLFYFPAIPKPWELPPLPPPCMYSNRWRTSNVILNYYHLKSAFSSNPDFDFHKYSISNFRLKYNGKIIPSEWLIFITVKSRILDVLEWLKKNKKIWFKYIRRKNWVKFHKKHILSEFKAQILLQWFSSNDFFFRTKNFVIEFHDKVQNFLDDFSKN